MPKFNTTVEVPVRFSDTDAMGHVNNARYLHFMEEGRVAYFKAIFPDRNPRDAASLFPFILADAQCAFKSPVVFGETVVVSLGVVEMKNSSFVVEYEMTTKEDGRLVASGRTVLVCYDYGAGKSVSIPKDLRERIRNRDGPQKGA
jgi:acyl-CoA thioester hydrolase